MNKLTTLALAGALAVSSLASASVTRWTGFGVSSLFIADVQDTFTLPQTVASNADAMYLEFGPGAPNTVTSIAHQNSAQNITSTTSIGLGSADGSAWGGANLKLGPGVLGVWGNRPYDGPYRTFSKGIPNKWPTTGINPTTAFLTPTATVDIFYAWEMGDKMALGVGLNRSGDYSGTKNEPLGGLVSNSDKSAIDYGLSLGVDIKELGPISALQVGLQYNFGGAENKVNDGTVTNSNTETWSIINLRVGADINGDNGKFQRVEIGYGLSLAEAKTKPAVAPLAADFDKATASGSLLTLGWAMGKSSSKGMGLAGLILTAKHAGDSAPKYNGNAHAKSDFAWDDLNLAFVTAGEGKLNSWLTGRAGFSTTVYNWQTNSTDALLAAGAGGKTLNYLDTYSTTLTLGLSIAVGDIIIDGALNQDLLYNGPYVTNGIATPLFSQVSATWAWGAKE